MCRPAADWFTRTASLTSLCPLTVLWQLPSAIAKITPQIWVIPTPHPITLLSCPPLLPTTLRTPHIHLPICCIEDPSRLKGNFIYFFMFMIFLSFYFLFLIFFNFIFGKVECQNDHCNTPGFTYDSYNGGFNWTIHILPATRSFKVRFPKFWYSLFFGWRVFSQKMILTA